MKWRWRWWRSQKFKIPVPESNVEAVAEANELRLCAERKLLETMEEQCEVRKVVETTRELQMRNHFGDAVEQAMRRS